MSATSIARPIGGTIAVLGGLLLLGVWGLYLSLWTIVGIILGCLSMFGGSLIFSREYVRGGTMAAAAAIIAWGLYPTHPLSTIMLSTVLMMGVGGVIGIGLEVSAE